MKSLLCIFILSALMTASAGAKPIVKVSAVQMRSSANLQENVQKIAKYLERLSSQGVNVAVFPECALTSYNTEIILKTDPAQLASALDSVAAACKKNKIYAVVGTPLFRPDGKLWNSAVVFAPTGKVIERYHKVHLAEDWPQQGDHLALFNIAGTKATIIICHDERYPELVRLPAIAGAKMVFYISSESGVKAENKMEPYRAQIQARAVENGVWIIHSNPPCNDDLGGSHGQSRIIKPDGNIIAEASMFDETVVTAELDIARADGAWARESLNSSFLKEFWETGLKALEKK
ncbi:MAG: carbon-nitrogen hydrolase family protein [Armatimonadota bacterium]|nr:carbon-nitrogen hydrolase family protein [Armatimonadota bacterium]